MKHSIKYLATLCVVLVCVYGFWIWLQYKWATVIKQTTTAIMTQLQTVGKLETISKPFTKTIEGEQELTSLIPMIAPADIIGSSIFKDKMVLEVKGNVQAGYMIKDVQTGDIQISRDGAVTIVLWAPQVFGVTLTGTSQTTKLGITQQKDIDMENQLRQKAGEMMVQEALSGNILQEAKNNAQKALQDLFLNAWIQIKEVIIKWTGDIN